MYKLINNFNVFVDDILEAVCKNRGVSKEIITKQSPDNVIHYSKLKNIHKAVQLFTSILDNNINATIVIVIDPDVDGYSSSAILVQYIEKNFPNVKLIFLFQSGKQHGLTDHIMKQIVNLMDNDIDIDLLIVPDAGSNDFKEHERLDGMGIRVICLDHHSVEGDVESEFAIVVNNQLSPEYDNKQLSGVGVVLKFLNALDDKFGINDSGNYGEIVSLGLVADVMDLTSPETRYLVYKGLTQIKNEYLKEMIFKNIGKYDKLYPYSLSFNLIPKMNAIIRVGSQEEKEELFLALIGRNIPFYNTRRKVEETLQYKMTRIGGNVHKKQGDTKKKWIKLLKQKVEDEGLDSNKVIVITLTSEDDMKIGKKDKVEKFDKALTGVIASALTSYYRKPVLIMHHNETKGTYGGSLRGFDSVLSDTKTFLQELNLFNFVQGHAQAGGVEITEDNYKLLNNAINEKLQFSNDSNNSLIDVDFVVPSKNVNKSLIEKVYSYEKYWGKGIEPPTFAILDVQANMKNVKVSDGGMIKWNVNGVDYTQFSADKRLIEYAETNNTLKMNVVGKLSVNNFMGNTSYQVMIDDFEILSVEETKSFSNFVW